MDGTEALFGAEKKLEENGMISLSKGGDRLLGKPDSPREQPSSAVPQASATKIADREHNLAILSPSYHLAPMADAK